MNIYFLLLNLFSQTASWVIVILIAYLLIKNLIKFYLGIKKVPAVAEDNQQSVLLKLQAHERLIVFIERINPSSLFIRVHEQGMSLAYFHSVILNDIRAEYQHNIAQQLYVKPSTWKVIKNLQEDTIAMVNNAVKELPEDSMGIDLSRIILQHMASVEGNPYELTQNLITRDMQEWF